MSKPAPKRALPQSTGAKLRGPLLIAGASVATLAIAGTVFALSQPGRSATGDQGRGCPEQASVLVDPAWATTVQSAADAWGSSLGKDCRPLDVTPQLSSVVARNGLGEADGWFPEDLSSLQTASDATVRDAKHTKVGSSPLVVVTQAEAAKAIPGGLQGETLRKMITLDNTWADYGHKEWGHFKLVLPNPQTTVAGAAAFGSLMQQAGRGTAMPENPVAATQDQLNMAKVEQRLVARPELADVIGQLAPNPSDENGNTPAGPRTGVTTLSQALTSDTKLGASFLDTRTGLTLVMANPEENRTLDKFSTWLTSKAGAEVLAKSGVDTALASPDAARLQALGLPAKLPNVQPNVVQQMEMSRKALGLMQKRTSTLLVVDASGSMAEPLGPGGPKRIEALTGLALGSWDAWPPGMANGLITFRSTNDAAMKPVIKVEVPLQLDTTKEWRKERPKFRNALLELNHEVSGGTPLYQAIATAWRYNVENYQNGLTNRIVVVTDGRDEDADSEVSYDQLMEALPKEPDPTREIKVTYVALGPDADFATLQKIAKATNQKAMQINSVDDLQNKMAELMVS
ncbi:substrate-binding domain-containing protein [Luteococcus sp. Sow4_B9]|uniref:vWA domain-containing protein n=1 Tax=Luteococcus sp. Sow4_B9 TaxID=3438792 RepID=UPI003F9BAC80